MTLKLDRALREIEDPPSEVERREQEELQRLLRAMPFEEDVYEYLLEGRGG